MRRRALSLCMALAMCLSLLPPPVLAAELSETVREAVEEVALDVETLNEEENDETTVDVISDAVTSETEEADAAEPVEAADADAAEPVEAADADAAEPVETADADAAEPVETADADAAEPVETADADAAEPVETADADAGLLAAGQSYYVGTFEDLKAAIDRSNSRGARGESGYFTVEGRTTQYVGITLQNGTNWITATRELLISEDLIIDLANVTLAAQNNSGGTKRTHRVFRITNEATLTLNAGAKSNGIIGGNITGNGGAILVENGVLELDQSGNVKISGGAAANGGGVYVSASGVFNMNGNAEVSGNSATGNGGGVYVEDGGKFTLNKGGRISGNDASGNGGGVYVAGGDFTMTGATIEKNGRVVDNKTSVQYGGGVYIANGAFNMNSGNVNENKAVYGGGVYVAKDAAFNMKSGSISGNGKDGGNYATTDGGGVYIAVGGAFELTLGNIQNNGANRFGGGVYFAGGTFRMNGEITQDSKTKALDYSKSSKIIGNEAGQAGGGVYVNNDERQDEKSEGFILNGGQIAGNTITGAARSEKGKAMGAGVYVNSGKTFTLISGEVQRNGVDFKNGIPQTLSNVYLFGSYNNYVASGNRRNSDTAKIKIAGNLYAKYTKIGLTVEAFEMDPDHQALYISTYEKEDGGNDPISSYAKNNVDNEKNSNISKFIVADNDDWAIVLVSGETISIQDEFVSNEDAKAAKEAGNDDPTKRASNVAIAINQWKYLQDMIFRAVTGNETNTSVVVSQTVVAQDTDVRLIVGNPHDYPDVRPYQGVKEPLVNYEKPNDEDGNADPSLNKDITLDLHGYKINRLLYQFDNVTKTVKTQEDPRADGYVIRINNGYTLTVVNVDSSSIGEITGGHDNASSEDTTGGNGKAGQGGGIYVANGAKLVLQAGNVTGNRAAGSAGKSGNGGGVYVEEGASFIMDGATSKVTDNEATKNGGGIYVDGDPMDAGIHLMEGAISGNYARFGGGIYSNASNADNAIELGVQQFFLNHANFGGGIYIAKGALKMVAPESASTPEIELFWNWAEKDSHGQGGYGGGVYVQKGAKFTLESGSIKENGKRTTADMDGNLQTQSDATVNGGGVYVDGEFEMTGGELDKNYAENGAGVYIVSYVAGKNHPIYAENTRIEGKFTQTGGDIQNNEAKANGGGVYVEGQINNGPHGEYSLQSGVISKNKAKNGAGVYIVGSYVDKNTKENYSVPNPVVGGGGILRIGFAQTDDGITQTTSSANPVRIINNEATENGGGVYANNSFEVAGYIRIRDNKGAGGNNNVYLPEITKYVLQGLRTRATVAQIVDKGLLYDGSAVAKQGDEPKANNSSVIFVTLGKPQDSGNYIITFTTNFYQKAEDGTNPPDNRFVMKTGDVKVFQPDEGAPKNVVVVPVRVGGVDKLEATILEDHSHRVQWHNGTASDEWFKPIVTNQANEILFYQNKDTASLDAGMYYLFPYLYNPNAIAPYVFAKSAKISEGDVNICLNGVGLKLVKNATPPFTVEGSGNFGLFNFSGKKGDGGIELQYGPNEGGFIEGREVNGQPPVFDTSIVVVDGTGYLDGVSQKGAEFNMYGGNFQNIKTKRSVVEVKQGLFDINGGSISKNQTGLAAVYVHKMNSGVDERDTCFKLRGDFTEIKDNQGQGTEAVYPDWYGGIFVDSNAKLDTGSNFWMSDRPKVSGNTSKTATGKTQPRNIFINNPLNTDQTPPIYIYAFMEIAKIPVALSNYPKSKDENPNDTGYRILTSDYNRIHSKNFTDKNDEGEFVYKTQFVPEEGDPYLIGQKSPSANRNEITIYEHTHVWNFYRDEVDKKLYAYCQSDSLEKCDYHWVLAAGSNLEKIEMVMQLKFNSNGNGAADEDFTPASQELEQQGTSFVKPSGNFEINKYFRAIKADNKQNYDPIARSAPYLPAKLQIHIADPETTGFIAADPRSWIDVNDKVPAAQVLDNHEYTAILLANYNGQNSPCVEFKFTIGKKTEPEPQEPTIPANVDLAEPKGTVTLADLTAMFDKIREYSALESDFPEDYQTYNYNGDEYVDALDYNFAFQTYLSARKSTASLSSADDEALSSFSLAPWEKVDEVSLFSPLKLAQAQLLDGEKAKIEVGTASGRAGETVMLPVNITSNPGIKAFELSVSGFEPLELSDVMYQDGIISDWMIDFSDGIITGITTANPVSATGTLFQLVFKIPDNPEKDSYPVVLSLNGGREDSLRDGQKSVGVEFVNGAVNVQSSAQNPDATETEVELQFGELAPVKPGNVLEIPVIVAKNANGFSAYQLKAVWNNEILELQDITAGEASPSSGTFTADKATGNVTWNALSPTNATGTLFILRFSVKDGTQNGNFENAVRLRFMGPGENGNPNNFAKGSARLTTNLPLAVSVTVDSEYKPISTINIPADMSNGKAQANPSPAKAGETITLTVTPDAGYKLDTLSVTANEKELELTEAGSNAYTFVMPDVPVSVNATFKRVYNVTVANVTGGTVIAEPNVAAEGEVVKLTVTPATGFNRGALTVTYGEDNVSVNVAEDDSFVMPGDNVTVATSFDAKAYSVTVNAGDNGKAEANPTSAIAGTTISLNITPNQNYEVDVVGVKDADNKDVALTENNSKFVMPNGNVTVTVSFKAKAIGMTVNDIANGKAEIRPMSAVAGETVTLTVTPDEGYRLDTVSVTAGGKEIELTEVGLNTYTFKMPNEAPSVNAAFKRVYNVTIANVTDGSVTVEPRTAVAGETVKLIIASDANVTGLSATYGEGVSINIAEDNSFIMPEGDVTVTVSFQELYTVTVNSPGSGSGKFKEGDSVTITAPEMNADGQIFSTWSKEWVALPNFDTSTVSGVVTATFTMPSSNVELTPSYVTPGGCYVATAVYGSYDCPEVWTLRRFRDDVLAQTWYGRLFIRLYYAVSPTAVKLFGDCQWFQNFFRNRLDEMVSGLQADGFESTPYEDRAW